MRTNAVEYICKGGEIRGLQFLPTRHGLDVRTGPIFEGQGHQDQFIAEMAQWGMPIDTKFIVGGKDFTYEDFVRHSLARVSLHANQELSWAILIISQYRSTNLTWTNEAGETLRFEDIVRYELDQPIDSAACGGTHRLFGLTWAYHLHMNRGGQQTGVWNDVVAKIEQQKKRARQYQNTDGSFSTKYLAGPGQAKEVQPRIGSTGHVLEWLSLALSNAELRETWVQDAANALSLLILDNQDQSIESGAMSSRRPRLADLPGPPVRSQRHRHDEVHGAPAGGRLAQAEGITIGRAGSSRGCEEFDTSPKRKRGKTASLAHASG